MGFMQKRMYYFQEFGKYGGYNNYKNSGIGLLLLSLVDILEWNN